MLERVGTPESMQQAVQVARPGAMIGYVGVPHGVQFDGRQLFFAQVGLLGGPAPVRRFLPDLIDLVMTRKINPGKVFDLEVPLGDVAEGYRAMGERRPGTLARSGRCPSSPPAATGFSGRAARSRRSGRSTGRGSSLAKGTGMALHPRSP